MKERKNRKGTQRKIMFWNVAGIGGKDVEFWNFIKRFDYIGLGEIWITEKK